MSDTFPPDAIQWHEGMLLAPQHFQQQSLRSEMLLQHHLQMLMPYYWGVTQLNIDFALLVDGTFRINNLVATLPDALLVRYPGEGEVLEIDLKEILATIIDQPLMIYLAVPQQKSAAPGKGELERYVSVEGPAIADANTGEAEVRIPRLHPRAKLVIGEKPQDKYVSIPIAEVVIQNEAVVLSDFIAPTLAVGVDTPLGKRCIQLAQRIREKAVYMSERMQSPSSVQADPLVAETRGIVRALTAELPLFEAIVGSGKSHPHTIYLALCSMIGKLAAIGGACVPPALPTYRHNDLRKSFERPLEFANRMIDQISESHVSIPFVEQDGNFHLHINPLWLGDHLVVGVRVSQGVEESEVVDWMQECVIGSQSTIGAIISRRIRGVAREQIDRDAGLDIVPMRSVVLFSLQVDDAFIKPDEPLIILNRADLQGEHAPAEIILFTAGSGAPGKGD